MTPRLDLLEGLLDVSNTCDRGCHELCLSDLNSIRHALIELKSRLPHGLNVRVSAGQQILVSSDLTSQCLGLVVTLS